MSRVIDLCSDSDTGNSSSSSDDEAASSVSYPTRSAVAKKRPRVEIKASIPSSSSTGMKSLVIDLEDAQALPFAETRPPDRKRPHTLQVGQRQGEGQAKSATEKQGSKRTGAYSFKPAALSSAPGIQQHATNTTPYSAHNSRIICINDSDDNAQAKPRQKTWVVRFKELCEYHQKKEDCLVSPLLEDNRELGEWVAEQRHQYKLLAEEKESDMTPVRQKALEDIGFVWRVVGSNWQEQYELLAEYKNVHGHCRVPHTYRDNPYLGRWVSMQRENYKLSKTKGTSTMTPERQKHLSDMGFEWVIVQQQQGIFFDGAPKLPSTPPPATLDDVVHDNAQLVPGVEDDARQAKNATPTTEDSKDDPSATWQQQLVPPRFTHAPLLAKGSNKTEVREAPVFKVGCTKDTADFSSSNSEESKESGLASTHMSLPTKAFSHHLLLGGVPAEITSTDNELDTPVNAAADDNDASSQKRQMPQDALFQSDPILNPVELELLWLGEESMFCLSVTEYQFDFIYEYASSALKVELRKLSQDDSETKKLRQIVRIDECWLVAKRVDFVRKEVQKLLCGGFRRAYIGLVIAELRLLRRGQSPRHFPPIYYDYYERGTKGRDPSTLVANKDMYTIQQVDAKTMNVVATFPSQSEAERQTGITRKCINRSLRQGRPKEGYLWRLVRVDPS